MVDLSKLNFLSTVNYLKQDVSSGNTLITLPGYGLSVTKTIEHKLGYIPFFQVFSEINQNGVIWTTKVNKYTETSLSGPDYPEPQISYWATTETLNIRLDNTTNPLATGDIIVYYLIYKDYGAS
jgi:hypothetical protein